MEGNTGTTGVPGTMRAGTSRVDVQSSTHGRGAALVDTGHETQVSNTPPTLFRHGLLIALMAVVGALWAPDTYAQRAPLGPLNADPILSADWVRPGPVHKVIVDKTNTEALELLQGSDAVLLSIDYESFVLFVVDETTLGGGAALLDVGVGMADHQDIIPLDGLLLDGAQPESALSRLHPDETFGLGIAPQAGLYLVQFVGPVQDSWLQWLTTIGAELVQSLPMNAYVVRVGAEQLPQLEALHEARQELQFVGAWQPAYRMSARLRQVMESSAGAPQPVTIQLVAGPEADEARDWITTLSATPIRSDLIGPYENVAADIDPVHYRLLARHPAVFALETRGTPERTDEVQGQIVAGNAASNGATSPGYLAWLSSMGFGPNQFGSFAVNVVDDAFTISGHEGLPASRIAFQFNPSGQTFQTGHGFFNAHIVGGYNNAVGSVYEDSSGRNYGLGVAPWARVGSTGIFGPVGASAHLWERQAYQSGARISSNSWRYIDSFAQPILDYDSSAQTYDFLARDADATQAGNQEYTILFAAGNDGPDFNTVGAPGTAKNIITVGASESRRPEGSDGCLDGAGADDIRDIVGFSSRGPVNASGGDGRVKPDLVAPGSHIQSAVPPANYTGAGLCDDFWPLGQTRYSWSSGTSHSTPAVAGGAALVRQWFLNQGLGAPSPAMVKAVLLNSAAYMTGVGASDSLPSMNQGMGRMHLTPAFDSSARRVLQDQSTVFSATGQLHQVFGVVPDSDRPFRVSLAWTDAPGSINGGPWVNDLDLQVTVGGQTYLGNVFSGTRSVTGGSRDFRNNHESVFLPAGTSGAFTVTVIARAINGDGLRNNADQTDQDFALIIHNGDPSGGPQPPSADFVGSPTTGIAPLDVNFEDRSRGTVSGWTWDFGDGAKATNADPTHTYQQPGSYTVRLTASGPTGSDVLTRTAYIKVLPEPTAGPDDGSFEGQGVGGAPASPWIVYFGNAHVVHPTIGSTDGAMPTDGSRWAEIAADGTHGALPPNNPGGLTNPALGGAGIYQDFQYPPGLTTLAFDAVFLRHEQPGTSRNDWMSVDITDGSTTLNLLYKDSNSPTVGASSNYGLATTPMDSVAVDLATRFPGSSPGTTFRLTALVGNGLDGTQHSKGYIDNVRLIPPTLQPTAGFAASPMTGTAPLTVGFQDQSTGPVTGWTWFFGDGTTSNVQSPTHLYTQPGTYPVTLNVSGPRGGDAESKAGFITVLPDMNAPPVAAFSASPVSGPAPLQVSFSDLSEGEVSGWSWSFGDGGTASVPGPVHTYTTPGTYTVSLTVNGNRGSDTETKVGYVTITDTPTLGPPGGSFEGQPAGAVPGHPWAVYYGTGHRISPSGVSSDGPMPTAGSQWCELAADSSYDARPPSHPGGLTNPALGGAGIYQDFQYTEGNARLSFEAIFLRHEPANSPNNDWMSVDITDGSSTVNLYYKDTSSATVASSLKYGYAATALETPSVDLRTWFPSSTPSTTFRLTALVGNGGGGGLPSKGYIDNVRFGP